MTNRRRNALILLLVAGLLAASLYVISSRDTKLGLDLRGGVELVYQAEPTPQSPEITPESLERAIDVMRQRVDALGVSEPEIQRSGENQIAVGLPDVDNAEQAQEQVGQVAQLYFYDWEPNVIGRDGEPAPDDPQATGGDSAGSPQASLELYEAVQIASEREPERGNNTHNGLFYGVDEENEEVLEASRGRPLVDDTREEVEEAEAFQNTEGASVVEIPEGTVIVRAEQPDEAPVEEKGDEWYVLRDEPALRGTEVKNPEQNFDQGAGGSGGPIVTFEFTDEGARKWEETTREIAERGQGNPLAGNQHFAIVLDDELISVPFIDWRQNPTGIDASNGSQIEGGFTIETAQELANLLKTGALPVRLELISQSQVSATLGQESLDQGLAAGAAGFAIVAIFLLVFYRVLGVIAVMALCLYGAYFFALIKLIPVTLTLPGIAGTILTLGVAADANIVIFERVKEEIRGGRSAVQGIAAGYKKGLGAIIDANVVTIMVAFILFVLATAGVKGFALTLGLGTIVSLFTAVLATQAALGTMGRSKFIAQPSALGAGKKKRPIRFDFVGNSKWMFSASGVILIICAIALGGKGIDLGIDFESGTRIRAALEQPTNVDGIREAVATVGLAEAEIQAVDDPAIGQQAFQISTESLDPDQVTEVTAALDDEFGIEGEPNTQSIGPTFGETVAKNAIIAVIVSLLVISVYLTLRFGWKYAAPVMIALTHDLLITAGIYSLIGFEVTAGTVAALLTILGFSLYDTIIVFDRIRENVPRMPRATFSQIVNRSMSEVVVRSLATSFTATLPVFMLLVFGGETLADFAFALLIGTLSGTYSSLFIAAQVLSHWKEREPVYRRRRRMIATEHGGMVPAYAEGSAAADVDPQAPRRARQRLTAPGGPDQGVSREEFDDMVRELHVDPPPTGTAVQEPDTARDADPSELYMKGDAKQRDKSRDKPRKPKNRKHGRSR